MNAHDEGERVCVVNCGLPGDQCACQRAMMRRMTLASVGWTCPVCGAGLSPSTSRCGCRDNITFTAYSTKGMERLGADFEKVWDENTERLYEK